MEPKEIDIEFTRGDTQTITFDVTDNESNKITAPDEIWFTVKTSYSSQNHILQKRYSLGQIRQQNGIFIIPISHQDTKNLSYGKYVYDVQIKIGEYYQTIYIGSLQLTNEVTFE